MSTPDRFPIALDTLIAYVHALHPDGGPLDHLADAVVSGDQLTNRWTPCSATSSTRPGLRAHLERNRRRHGREQAGGPETLRDPDDDLIPEGKAFARFAPRARGAMAAAGQLAGIESREPWASAIWPPAF